MRQGHSAFHAVLYNLKGVQQKSVFDGRLFLWNSVDVVLRDFIFFVVAGTGRQEKNR